MCVHNTLYFLSILPFHQTGFGFPNISADFYCAIAQSISLSHNTNKSRLQCLRKDVSFGRLENICPYRRCVFIGKHRCFLLLWMLAQFCNRYSSRDRKGASRKAKGSRFVSQTVRLWAARSSVKCLHRRNYQKRPFACR